MAWLAVNENGTENIFSTKPERCADTITYGNGGWSTEQIFYWEDICDSAIKLPRNSIKKLIGRKMTWDDEPVEI